MHTIYLVTEDNTAPNLTVTLQRDNVAIDVTGHTVDMIINNEATRAITNSGHQACALVTAASGIIRYTPQVNDFPAAGRYVCDFRVNYAGGTSEILYEQLLVVVREKNNS